MPAGISGDDLFPSFSNSLPKEYATMAHDMPRNISSPYSHDDRSTPVPQYISSEHSTTYSSPGSHHWAQDGFVNEQHSSSYPYAYPNPELVGNSPYQTYGRSTPASDRSDRSIGDSRYQGGPQWTRPQNASKPKAKKKKKGEDNGKTGMPADQPVPILSKDTDAPIQDIERFVNRSIEARRKEVEGKNGYRPRPMNNFMLYRKAYQEKAKQVSSQNNHQVVSVIVAASWKNEPAEVKDKFAKYAQIEKDNHILAFPDYQFRPNKSQKPKKRKPGFDTDDDSWADLDDTNDPEWGRSSSKRPRPRQTKQTVYDQDYGFSTDFGQPAYGIPYHSDPRSTFGTLSPAKPSPIPIHEQAQDMYYNNRLPNPYQDLQFDDAQWISGRVNVPFPSHTSALPGTGDALLNPDDFGPVVHYDTSHLSRLDPLLVTEDTGANGAFTQSAFENLNNLGLESGWEDHRPSLSGAILTAGQNESAVYDEEQFAQFLKS